MRSAGLAKRYGSDASCSTGSTRRSTPAACTRSSARPARGKTTLLHLLAGLELPDAGEVAVDGAELTALDRAARAALRRAKIALRRPAGRAGAVPLRARERRARPRAARARREEPARALDRARVGRARRARDAARGRLSQGERARVAIARAIASKPALLLADEPTSRLDGANAIAVAVLLARLAREAGAAVVCSTHDPLVIEQADAQITL